MNKQKGEQLFTKKMEGTQQLSVAVVSGSLIDSFQMGNRDRLIGEPQRGNFVKEKLKVHPVGGSYETTPGRKGEIQKNQIQAKDLRPLIIDRGYTSGILKGRGGATKPTRGFLKKGQGKKNPGFFFCC